MLAAHVERASSNVPTHEAITDGFGGIQVVLRLVSVLVLASALAACGPIDAMKEGFVHSEAVSAELEKTVGTKSVVGFDWNNGVLTSVNVTFQGIPPNLTLAEIVEKSRQAIAADFKQTPRQIFVGFNLTP